MGTRTHPAYTKEQIDDALGGIGREIRPAWAYPHRKRGTTEIDVKTRQPAFPVPEMALGGEDGNLPESASDYWHYMLPDDALSGELLTSVLDAAALLAIHEIPWARATIQKRRERISEALRESDRMGRYTADALLYQRVHQAYTVLNVYERALQNREDELKKNEETKAAKLTGKTDSQGHPLYEIDADTRQPVTDFERAQVAREVKGTIGLIEDDDGETD